jgi:exopolyphosphatase / guanosine-5'-triphosphate,3'-diphosphate pyrophosphatase
VTPHGRDAVAALDCGTNSTRLLISAPGRPALRRMRITRLGKGVDATGRLDPESIARTLEALREYRGLLDDHEVARARMVATSAVRDADNGAEFLAAASDVVGVDAELLDGETEGALAFAGATASLDVPTEQVVVVDIGGGSTELVTGAGGIRAISLDLGCVRVTERFFHHDPPENDELEAAASFVDGELERAAAALPALSASPRTLVGLAGTVSTLGALAQGLSHYDRDRIHHVVLSAGDVSSWLKRLAAEPAAARARRPGLAPGREDVIVGGVLVLDAVMARFGFDRCIVSEADLLDGIAAGLL